MPKEEFQWEIIDHCHDCLARLWYNDGSGKYKWSGGNRDCLHIATRLWSREENTVSTNLKENA